MSNPKISIIMPVYNAEKWIERSIYSCLNQTYANIELICVDDCSCDNSVTIIKKIQKTDKRLVLIQNQENVGPGGGRNMGLKAATGEYVAFIDNDDFYEVDAMERMYHLIQKYKTKAIFANWSIEKGKEIIPQNHYSNELYVPNSASMTFFISPWAKLIDIHFIRENHIVFGKGFVAEDRVFQVSLLACLDQVYLSKEYVYRWNHNNKNSITMTGFNKGRVPRLIAYLSVAQKCLDIIRDKKPQLFNPEYEICAFYNACLNVPFPHFKECCNRISQIVGNWELKRSDFTKKKNWKKYRQLKNNCYIRIFLGTKVKEFRRKSFKKVCRMPYFIFKLKSKGGK